MSSRRPPAKAPAQPSAPPPSGAAAPSPAAAPADDKPQAATKPSKFKVGDVARLTTGDGEAKTTELVIVTSDEGKADVPNQDGNYDHLYTVSRVPAGHAVRADQLTAV